MNRYISAVSGPSCSYVKLATYNNCSNAEVASSIPVASDYVYKAPTKEGFDPTSAVVDTSLSTAPTNTPNYTPQYTVPNYAPITTLNTGNSCSGYSGILNAYGGMDGSGSCTTNYINN